MKIISKHQHRDKRGNVMGALHDINCKHTKLSTIIRHNYAAGKKHQQPIA